MWPLALTLLALTLVAFVAAGTGGPEDEANGSPAGDGKWETEGNWTVEAGEDLLYENLTLFINGNLTVDFGGKLTLRGVKLIMNCTEPLQYTLRITTGGELVVEDTDGNRTTTNDRSELRSWYLSARYTIQVDGGAKMTVARSRIADIGDEGGVGMQIESDEVLFQGALLESFHSIFVDGAAPTFRQSRFTGDLESSFYFQGSGVTFEECVIINCYYGINARGKPSPQLVETDVANCFFPMILEDADVTMRGGLLEAAPYGTTLTMTQASKATFVDVIFDQYDLNITDAGSTVFVRWTLSLRVTDQAYQPLEGAHVEVNDTGGATVFTGTTGPDGTVDAELLDLVITISSRETRNLHTVWVQKDRYHARATFNVTFTASHDLSVLTNLAPFISVRSPLPGTRVVMGQQLTFDASDTYDPNGDPMTFTWTTDIGDRQLYTGPDPVFTASLLLGESQVRLSVSDGQGGVNTTTVAVQVLQATQGTFSVTETFYTATLKATYGGSGTIVFEEASYPQPYPRELIGVFLRVRATGDAILASGELTVTYSTSLIPYGMTESSLGVAKEDGGVFVYIPGSGVDTGLHKVTADADGFGLYAVMGYLPDNIPPRLWLQEGDQLVEPHDLVYRAGEEVDLFFVIEDELDAFARLEVPNLPDFLRLDGTTKRITGTVPAREDTYQLTLMAVDIGDLSDTHSIDLVVNGSLLGPQLHSGVVDPGEGDTYTHFTITVLYLSPENLAPAYVRARFGDNETVELTPENLTDDEFNKGVIYRATVRLERGTHKVWFEASDGIMEAATEEPVRVEVSAYSLEVTDQELALIVAAIIGTVVIIMIIRATSERYSDLRKAQRGRDREDQLEYIQPGRSDGGVGEPPKGADDGPAADEAEVDEADVDEADVDEDGEEVHAARVDAEEVRRIEGEVDRLESELSELDGEIDREEEELARIDEEIEEIIDELDTDRDRAA